MQVFLQLDLISGTYPLPGLGDGCKPYRSDCDPGGLLHNPVGSGVVITLNPILHDPGYPQPSSQWGGGHKLLQKMCSTLQDGAQEEDPFEKLIFPFPGPLHLRTWIGQ